MKAQLIIPTAQGDTIRKQLALHNADTLKIALSTSEEVFEPWLFYLLRDLGAYIETNDPPAVVRALKLSQSEEGIRQVSS